MTITELLKSYGYKNEDIDKIINYLDGSKMKNFKEAIINSLKDYESLGYKREEIIKMTKIIPNILLISKDNKDKKMKYMESLGYTKEEIIKMTIKFPQIYCVSNGNISKKIDDMITLGYTKEDVIKMTKLIPSLFGNKIDNIKLKINDLVNLGYKYEDIIKMTINLPSMFCYSIDTIKDKRDFMISLGYSEEEVTDITKSLPPILGLSKERLKEKLEFYDSIGMHDLPIIAPMRLMQSTKVSYARYMFFNSIGVEINMDNYNFLFLDNKTFEHKYGLNKEELLNLYPYEKESVRDNGKTLNIGISEDTKESRIEHINDDEIRRRKNKEELLHSKGINNLLFSIEEIHKIYPNINEFDLCDLIINDKYYNINYKSTTVGNFVTITCSDDRIIYIKVSRNMSYEWDYFSREKNYISEWVNIDVIYFISNKDNLIFRAIDRLDTNENVEIYYDSQDDNLHLKKIGWDLIPVDMPYLSLDYIASKQLNMDVEINKILEFINNNTLNNRTINILNDSIDRIKKMYEKNSENGILQLIDVSDDIKKIKNLINENDLSDNTTKKLRDLINKLYEEEKHINDSYSHTIPDIEKITKIKEGALNVSKSFSDEELNALAYSFLQGLEDKLSNKQLEKYYN